MLLEAKRFTGVEAVAAGIVDHHGILVLFW
jgi:hypothetical protein